MAADILTAGATVAFLVVGVAMVVLAIGAAAHHPTGGDRGAASVAIAGLVFFVVGLLLGIIQIVELFL